jgi:hypothetical protein
LLLSVFQVQTILDQSNLTAVHIGGDKGQVMDIVKQFHNQLPIMTEPVEEGIMIQGIILEATKHKSLAS